MTATDWPNRTRLGSSFALLLDKANLRTDGQLVEFAVENGILVKIDLAAVGRLDEAAILPGEEPDDAAVIFDQVGFDLAAQVADSVLDLPLRCGESLPDRDQRVLALMRFRVRRTNDLSGDRFAD